MAFAAGLAPALPVTYTIIPDNGPFVGGNRVLVTNTLPDIGNGSDITNIVIGELSGGIPARSAFGPADAGGCSVHGLLAGAVVRLV